MFPYGHNTTLIFLHDHVFMLWSCLFTLANTSWSYQANRDTFRTFELRSGFYDKVAPKRPSVLGIKELVRI